MFKKETDIDDKMTTAHSNKSVISSCSPFFVDPKDGDDVFPMDINADIVNLENDFKKPVKQASNNVTLTTADFSTVAGSEADPEMIFDSKNSNHSKGSAILLLSVGLSVHCGNCAAIEHKIWKLPVSKDVLMSIM